MKGILTILVLLVALAFVSASEAVAGEPPEDAFQVPDLENFDDQVHGTNGATDDGGDGDPGDAGDGYGAKTQNDILGGFQSIEEIDPSLIQIAMYVFSQLTLLP